MILDLRLLNQASETKEDERRLSWVALAVMALACGLTGITIPTRAADSFSFTTIDAPGATRTWASGINDAGQIVGSFNNHGYLRTSWGAFTTFDVPGATDTGAEGINNAGQIVGTFVAGDKNHGYVATPTR